MNIMAQLRKNKGVSQQSVADYLGISRQAYCNYETGKREAPYETLLQLSEYFETTVDEILGRRKQREVISDVKFALFGDDIKVTDEMYDDVKSFVDYIKEKKRNGQIK